MFSPLGSERSAAPADSVIPGLRACRHVFVAAGPRSTSLSLLRIGRQRQGLTGDSATEPGQLPLDGAGTSIERSLLPLG